MVRRCRVPLWLIFVALGLVACQTRPVPLSAQRGATIAIPLETASSAVGYGGTEAVDVQRGTLRWHLVDGNGATTELVTRFTGSLQLAPEADWDALSARRALVSVVDVPVTAPLGTHDLEVENEDGSPVEAPFVGGYFGRLQVLPEEIPVTGGGSIQGTPNANLPAIAPSPTTLVANSIPAPSLGIGLTGSVWSAEIQLVYDPERVRITGVVADEGHGTGAWLREVEEYTVQISAVGLERPFSRLSVLFEPIGGPVDPESEFVALILFASFTDAQGDLARTPLGFAVTSSLEGVE